MGQRKERSAFWNFVEPNLSTIATLVIGILATIGSFFGWIPPEKITTAILTVTCFLALESLIGRNKRFDEIDKRFDEIERFDEINKRFNKIDEKLERLHPIPIPIYPENVRIFKKEDDWYSYVKRKMLDAKECICDASLTQRSWDTTSRAAEEYYKARSYTVIQKKLHYRYVAVFSGENDKARFRMVRDYIKNGADFWAAYFEFDGEPTMPALNIVIIDENEVIVSLSPTKEGKKKKEVIAIEHPEISKLFVNYYESLWEEAENLNEKKEKGKIRSDLSERIGKRVGLKQNE